MPYKDKEENRKSKGRYQKSCRLIALSHYSNGTMKCACCNEYRLEFLSFDHIAGGGREHRAKFSGPIYTWLVARGFPEGFQVLCHNCNLAKGFYGRCPHIREKAMEGDRDEEIICYGAF